MKRMVITMLVLSVILVGAMAINAEVLGPCGTPDAQKPAKEMKAAAGGGASMMMAAPEVSPVPLPGQKAPNFELAALVGDEVKQIKLSDYDGKWRVVCFYPADNTFV